MFVNREIFSNIPFSNRQYKIMALELEYKMKLNWITFYICRARPQWVSSQYRHRNIHHGHSASKRRLDRQVCIRMEVSLYLALETFDIIIQWTFFTKQSLYYTDKFTATRTSLAWIISVTVVLGLYSIVCPNSLPCWTF